jgi:ABC-type uncharacterized transport system permease subunit
MQLLLTLSAILFYGISLGLLITGLTHNKLESTRVFSGFFYAATLLHTATLSFTVFQDGYLQLGFFSTSTLIFSVMSLLSCLSIARRLPIESLLILLIPFCMISLTVVEWGPTQRNSVINETGLIIHIVLSILAYSLITFAALQALALAAQESILRKHRLKSMLALLPPLQTMEKLLFEMIWFGFVLLTLSIISGVVFLDNIFAQHLAHKTFFSIIAWLIFGTLLIGRSIQGWRGITATKWTISGFIALMLAYFGSRFVLEMVLQRI